MDLLNEFVPNYTLASKTKRWVAAAMDYILCGIIWFTIIFVFGEEVIDEDGDTVRNLTGFPAFLATFVPWFILLPVLEAVLDGQTIGKFAFGLRVVKADGSKATFRNTFARHIVDIADYFPFFGIVGLIVASNSPQNQRVGDLVGKTIVINSRPV